VKWPTLSQHHGQGRPERKQQSYEHRACGTLAESLERTGSSPSTSTDRRRHAGASESKLTKRLIDERNRFQ
jgi:hypothetical protein